MTTTGQHLEQSFEILIDELMSDDELRDAFLRNPDRTLEFASDWGMPLSDSEVQSLRAPSFGLWDRVVDELEARFGIAA
jgi:hypothetical protein